MYVQVSIEIHVWTKSWNVSSPFPKQALAFMGLQYKSLKTLGKGEIAHNEQFLLFPQFFLPTWRTFCQSH